MFASNSKPIEFDGFKKAVRLAMMVNALSFNPLEFDGFGQNSANSGAWKKYILKILIPPKSGELNWPNSTSLNFNEEV
jgi:hypothetical protein